MNLNEIFDKYKYMIVLDTETTGLNSKYDDIIDLGAILVKKENGEIKIIDTINSLIKTNKKIPDNIVELTHITNELLEKDGENKLDVINKFVSFLNNDEKKIIATYNANFDLSFLRYFLKGYKFNNLDFLDIMTIYKDRAAYPIKLEVAVTHYNLDDKVKNSHRALDDTYACFEVLKAMSNEKSDIDKYINLFGYNKKYGIPKEQIKNVVYRAQDYLSEYYENFPLYIKR